jgi:tetratricopeptide (TPR) repeat protein
MGLQAIASKLLAPSLAERYGDATAIRNDLESHQAGRQTDAEREGWPRLLDDEPPTRRTRPGTITDEEPTRRTHPLVAITSAPPNDAAGVTTADAATTPTPKRSTRLRRLRAVLAVAALLLIFNEYRVGVRAWRLAENVPTRELDGLADVWNQYDSLRARSSFRVGVIRLERALVRQSAALADRVIGNYRTPVPTVREMQWRMAREALARAASVDPGNARVRASLRYCEGHLHRINGEARKARKQASEAQHEFTDAVAAFREAAELQPNWPDPFLGLTRTFIYGLEDVDRGADALQQAERLGYTPGDRETVQLADGYRARADTFARTARMLSGMAQEQEYLQRATEAYRQAVDRYSKALGFGDAARSLRLAQRGLQQVEQRLSDLSKPVQPTAPPAEVPRAITQWP